MNFNTGGRANADTGAGLSAVWMAPEQITTGPPARKSRTGLGGHGREE